MPASQQLPTLPANAPPSRWLWLRPFAHWVLRACGWRIAGQLPDMTHLVVIAAPHSSAWDAVWGLLAKLALGVRVQFMVKKELFWWPLGPVLRFLGGYPIDRASPNGIVEQFVARFTEQERFWLVIAPEGTRKPVEHWKKGFWRIATAAQVPVLCAYFHYPEKIIGLGPYAPMSGDFTADMRWIRDFYKPWMGKHRGI